ncbi:MAG: alpha-L-fucosidase [Dysgonamonadaceae bacterium]|nr:alpha-L-fucosidase [Dysgonamonadaceae bacterium]
MNIPNPAYSKNNRVIFDKMQWWREARFGMFIHWGVYAVYGNVYRGEDINGDIIDYNRSATGYPAEWIMSMAKIPRKIYREAANEFDAKDYDPRQWVEIAKNAGMKYIVITSKHHDGFCLFDSKYTDWDAVDASPAQRDLLKDLVAEAKKAGLKIGFYYSQNVDWMHEGGMGDIPELKGAKYPEEKVLEYVDNLVIPQIQELVDNYDIDNFWYDMPGANPDPDLAKKINDALLSSKVGDKIIVNDRLGGGIPGDFKTPETDTPEIPYNGYDTEIDWEACSSLHHSWGYEETPENDWKTPVYTISRILELASKGGNFLLNVGPDKHGNIPVEAVNTLQEVGKWMEKYGETIYGTVKNELVNPFGDGYVTQRNHDDGSISWFLHIPGEWNDKEVFDLPGVMERPVKATIYNSDIPVTVIQKADGLLLTLPSIIPDKYYSVIELVFAKRPEQIRFLLPTHSSKITLTPYQAVTTGGLLKDFYPYAFKYWYLSSMRAIWKDVYLEPGVYSVSTEISSWDSGNIIFETDSKKYWDDESGQIVTEPYNEKYIGSYPLTGNFPGMESLNSYLSYTYTDVKISIPRRGLYTFKIGREVDDSKFNIIQLRNVVLTRVREFPAGIDPIDDPSVKIYPNPAKDYVAIKTNVVQKIQILNLQGSVVRSFDSNNDDVIDVSSFPAGIYLVRVGGKIHKLIIR